MSRLTFVVIVMILTFTGVIFASRVKSQNIREVKLSINFKQALLKDVLTDLKAKTGFNFVYTEQVGNIADISISAKNESLYDVLKEIAGKKHLIFNQSNYLIAVNKAPLPPAPPPPGSIKGRIVEFESSQPLPGASVYILELQKGMQSNNDGYYQFNNLPPGKYTLKVTYISYTTETVQVEVKAGKEETYDVKMRGSSALSEVVVSGVRRSRVPVTHTTERQIVEELKAAQTVASGISSEQISKTADRNAAEVVRKISGVTVRDDKFIIIRGLNERYNLTYLNGNIAPSTELYSRAFSLDLIPSRIIDRIIVYKSPAPDLLADMTGGAVKVFTKDSRNVKHFDVEIQSGVRPNTTFKTDFLTYQGGSTDWLGFDNGTRKLPEVEPGYGDFTRARLSQKTYAESFTPYLQYGRKTAAPLVQLTANYYNTFKLGRRSLSMLSSLSYKNESLQLDIDRIQSLYGNDQQRSHQLINEVQSSQVAQLNLLQNFTYRLRDSSSLQLKNFVLQQGQTGTVLRNTDNDLYYVGNKRWTNLGLYGTNRQYRDIILSYTQRFLYSGNLSGNHYFKQGKQLLEWNTGYTYSLLSLPDQRIIHLQKRLYDDRQGVGDEEQNWSAVGRSPFIGTEFFNGNNSLERGMISRTWTRNRESVYNGSADYTWKVLKGATIKAGTYQQWKERFLFRRVYTLNEGDLNNNGYPAFVGPVGSNGQYIDYNLVNFKQQDLGKVWSDAYLRDNGSGLKVFDRTTGSDAYKASEQNNSGYFALSLLPFNGKLDIYGGVRVEYNRQLVAGAVSPITSGGFDAGAINTPVLVDVKATNILPSVNVSYRPDSAFVFRAAYGNTVNRPQFNEISPYIDLDYFNNQNIVGNPTLRAATIQNYDLRMELYPKGGKQGESISIGGFYKQMKSPIERVLYKELYFASPASISFANADQATVKGIELDIRKNLDFIPLPFFSKLSLIANGTLISSHATRKRTTKFQLNIDPEFDRQLQGQAPYVVNVGLYYDNAGTGTKAAVLFNQVGPRIYAASIGMPRIDTLASGLYDGGFGGSLIELTRRQLDFSVTQRLIKSLQLKFSVQNILNQPIEMAEDENYTFKYEKAVFTAPKNPSTTPGSVTPYTLTGDLIANRYRSDRYFIFSFTYSF